MSEALIQKDHYRSQFQQLETNLNGQRGSLFHQVRQDAMARFSELGFPTTRDEDWKYTNVAPIARTPFGMPTAGVTDGLPAGSLDRLKATFFGSLKGPLLVFVNGLFRPEHSELQGLPPGLTVQSLAAALQQEPERVEPFLARFAQYRDQAFVALNTAFLQDGAFIHVARGSVIEEPVRVLFLSSGAAGPTISHPRVLAVIEENAQATILESYAGEGDGAYFSNAVSELILGENSVLDHYKLQQDADGAYHVGTLQVYQAKSSTFASHSVSLGGLLTRNDARARLDGEGCETTLNGLFMVTGQQHVDNHTSMDHARARCNSREVYHGVLGGESTGVFNGKIFVRQDAQKTDARQTNRNLLLSRDAVIDTKPQLEIFADDVKCTHGATIGQLDEEAIFYLRARGIPHGEARNMLTLAFASEVVNNIRVEPLRLRLETLVGGWLAAALAQEEAKR
ncbi:MAG: Fe-S cluster assembly protein SufD [Armatimonadota bacterium]|nr:Fe-S cluster assembly protein SufD [Armatimonadota bacterium]